MYIYIFTTVSIYIYTIYNYILYKYIYYIYIYPLLNSVSNPGVQILQRDALCHQKISLKNGNPSV